MTTFVNVAATQYKQLVGSLAAIQRQQAFLLITTILGFLVYLLVAWVILPPSAVWSPDEGAKLLQTINVRFEEGRFAYDIASHNRTFDPDLVFAQTGPTDSLLTLRDGSLYFQRLPIFPLATLPFLQTMGSYGLYILPALGGALTSLLAMLLVQPGERRWGMWVVIAVGSPVFIYSTIFWEHTIATGFGLAGMCVALRRHPATTLGLLGKWSGVVLLISAGIYLRLELAIFALALFAAYWLLVPQERWWVVLAGVMLGACMVVYMSLHRLMFGQPVGDNALYLFYPFWYLQIAGWRVIPELLIGPPEDGAIDPGVLGWVWSFAAIIAILCSLLAQRIVIFRWVQNSMLIVTAVIAAAFLLSSESYRAAHGLLFTTPWVVIAWCRCYEVWQIGERQTRVVILTTLFGLTGYVIGLVGFRASSPHGALEWGARFAMVFYPLLALIAVWDIGRLRRQVVLPTVIGILLILGIGFQIRGLSVIYHDKQVNVALYQMLHEAESPYILTDLWWLHLNNAPLAPEQTVFLATTPERQRDWLERATEQEVQVFSLVTLNPFLLEQLTAVSDNQQMHVLDVHQIDNLIVASIALEED
ncbi:MAG: hypothetical protein AAGF95_07125 [Chloroflexota bacterium]